MSDYRIKAANVEVCDGYKCWLERRYFAERRIQFSG